MVLSGNDVGYDTGLYLSNFRVNHMLIMQFIHVEHFPDSAFWKYPKTSFTASALDISGSLWCRGRVHGP